MNFDEQLRLLREAEGDPARLALVTVDLRFHKLDENTRRALKEALEAASIPHWFDAAVLAALLEISLAEAEVLHSRLAQLTVVERFPARGAGASNVHEAARLALRRALWSRERERMLTLSKRARDHFDREAGVVAEIERLFHLILLDPERGGIELRRLEPELWHRHAEALALSAALREYTSDELVPSLTRAWACWAVAALEAPYLKLDERFALGTQASTLARARGSELEQIACDGLLAELLEERGGPGDLGAAMAFAESCLALSRRREERGSSSEQQMNDATSTRYQLASLLTSRQQPGDAERAQELLREALSIRESSAHENPESALAARDLSIGLARLAEFLVNRGQKGDAELALDHLKRSNEISERLLAANPESALAARDLSVGLVQLADFLVSRGKKGDAELALQHIQRSNEIRERLLAANPESAQAAREVSIGLARLADFLVDREQKGDAELALQQLQRSNEILERLLAANPESAQAARDVSLSLVRLADFLVSRGQKGDAERALQHLQRSNEINERLLAANPESAQAARDLSLSLVRLADFLVSRGQKGDAELALQYLQRSNGILERLLAANPESAQAARDLSIGLTRLADFLVDRGQKGDAELALQQLQRSNEIDERLFVANSDSAQAARELSIGLTRLADIFVNRGQKGDAELALQQLQRSNEIDERLFVANSDSALAARDLSVGLVRLADFLVSRGQKGDAELALQHLQRSNGILERLLAAYPESAQAARDLSLSLARLADFLASRGKKGDAELALQHLQRSNGIDERLLAANPESAQAARKVSIGLARLADFLVNRGQKGDAELALQHLQRANELNERRFAANPSSRDAARVLFGSSERLEVLLRSRGRPEDEKSAEAVRARRLEVEARFDRTEVDFVGTQSAKDRGEPESDR